MGELLKPLEISEPLVDLPDRKIAVIGTRHGQRTDDFPGRMQTETELGTYFDRQDIDGLMLDSLPQLHLIDPSQLSPTNFLGWGINYMFKHNTHLIAADPVYLNPGLIVVSKVEDNQFIQNRTRPLTSDEMEEIMRPVKINGLIRAAVIGSAIGFALGATTNISRRRFLGMLGGTLLGVSVASSIQFLFQQNYHIEGKVVVTDADEGDDLSDQTRELIEEDYETDFFKKASQENQEYMKFSLMFRNAIIADAMAQPIDAIMPLTARKKAFAATVMGWSHVVLPEEGRISWLLLHPEDREQVIFTLTQALFQGLREGNFGEIDTDQMREGFFNMGRSYVMNRSTNSIEAFQFPIPALEKAVKAVG